MSAFSVYSSNKTLDLIFNATAWTAPSATYLALFTSDAGLDSNVSGSQTEVSGGNYSRVDATAKFPASSAGTLSNDVEAIFSTASASWGTVTHFALMDAATVGNVLIWGALTDAKTVDTGDSVRFLVGTLTASLT